MEGSFFKIEDIYIYVVGGILIFFGLIEFFSGYYHRSRRTKSDWIQEAGSFFILAVLIRPAIVLGVVALGNLLYSDWQGMMLDWSLWISLPLYLIVYDGLQYWYHRSAHEHEFLWKLHRSHHQAEEMGFFVSYRNAGLYYVMMPNIWWTGIITFLGGGLAVSLALMANQFIIISSHSTIRWDAFLYKYPALNPIVNVLERIFITPAFHQAHHGKSKLDGISDPNGNFGNMLSIWDQLFGTASFPHQFPTELGLVNDPKDKWTASYFYPLIKSDKAESELAEAYQKYKTTLAEPTRIQLDAGRYLWCQCGFSKNQPFCDGSHHGTPFKPVLFELEKTRTISLCNCKHTKRGPFCDNSHTKILDE